ncbi:type I restriction endonuclease subunit R [Aerosakkonemataceae cyanobacterium BLCC-F154]|uniref:Type I restriction endonuclease subunit R n=1 Tax=Floridaenema fluviatile BLCC-F154 TaxID=3153640 RepID=A0ABV4Y9G3_9CYAN
MPESVGIAKAITNLNVAHERLSLSPTNEPNFFTEWWQDLPELTEEEKQALNRLKNRYLYYAADGFVLEGTVSIIILSPLLELLGLCDSPFKIRGEKFVKVEIENGNTELEGFIDALVIKDLFWVVLIEAKQYGFSVLQALPQALAYIVANPNLETPVFGLIMTGEDYIFVKLNQQLGQYALSRKFTLVNPQENELYEVVRVIKRIMSLRDV